MQTEDRAETRGALVLWGNYTLFFPKLTKNCKEALMYCLEWSQLPTLGRAPRVLADL